jgi:ubiquitin-like 1-activating enzyme E1 B
MALMGFRHVEVIDLDTIDQSNLNRQLLFRSQHVGQPKCKVSCEVAMNMIPDADKNATDLQPVHYKSYLGNVCDNEKFNVHFVKQFDLCLNALDNVVARRRVNRLCLAAGIPLVESGTTGYLGQVTCIDKASGVACYECTTQETQKVYPICTIR